MEQNKDTRYEVIKQSKSQDLLEEVLHTDASASTLADFLINENHVNDNSSKEKLSKPFHPPHHPQSTKYT